MLNLHRIWLQTGLALLIGAITVLPNSAHASQGPVDASTLGSRAPNAQEIQAELDLVRSQGVPIRVVGHFILPTMTVRTAQGQSVLAANVPVVEFEIGFIPVSRPSAPLHTGLPRGAAPAVQPAAHTAAHSRTHPLDSYYNSWWQDYANGPAGGSPTFYYSAHYNVTCTPSCVNYMTTINHQANISTSGYTFNGNFWSLNCSSSFPNWWQGSGNSWGVEYYDSASGDSCPQNST